jgi:hypothetical protein
MSKKETEKRARSQQQAGSTEEHELQSTRLAASLVHGVGRRALHLLGL